MIIVAWFRRREEDRKEGGGNGRWVCRAQGLPTIDGSDRFFSSWADGL